MKKIVDYKVVVDGVSSIANKVNKLIEDGYHPIGGISHMRNSDLYMQPMVKYAAEEDVMDESELNDKLRGLIIKEVENYRARKELLKNKEESKNSGQVEESRFKFKVGQKVKFTDESLKSSIFDNKKHTDKIYQILNIDTSALHTNGYVLYNTLGDNKSYALEYELELIEDWEEIKAGDWVEYKGNKHKVYEVYMDEYGYARVILATATAPYSCGHLLYECKKIQPPSEEIKFKKGEKVFMEVVVDADENADGNVFVILPDISSSRWLAWVRKSSLIKKYSV